MEQEQKYYYPKVGEQLGKYQPNLEYKTDDDEWIESGVITYTLSEKFKNRYRVKL
jgi:hypothetical protein